jgi:hypothetical protein
MCDAKKLANGEFFCVESYNVDLPSATMQFIVQECFNAIKY